MSEMHFRRVFQKSMNMTPSAYLNMFRIQNACRQLLKTDLSVETVAMQSGFSTVSTFNRNFRIYMDTSPLRWKKLHLEEADSVAGFRVRAHRGWDDDHV